MPKNDSEDGARRFADGMGGSDKADGETPRPMPKGWLLRCLGGGGRKSEAVLRGVYLPPKPPDVDDEKAANAAAPPYSSQLVSLDWSNARMRGARGLFWLANDMLS